MDCCKRTPKDRLTFRKILDKYEKGQLIDNILKDLDVTETYIQTIWEKASLKCKATNSKDIDFKKFYEFLIQYFHLLKKPEEAHYLKEALRLPFFLKLEQPDPTIMTRENFGQLGKIFMLTKKKDSGFIQRMVEVFKSEWFYGFVDRLEAQNQLEALSKKRKRKLHILYCSVCQQQEIVLYIQERCK